MTPAMPRAALLAALCLSLAAPVGAATPTPAAWSERAAPLIAASDWQGLISQARDWLARHPKDTQALLDLGRAQVETGYYDLGIAQCRRVLSLQANHPGALNLMGYAYLDTARYEQAEAVLNQALAAHPDNAPGHSLLSAVYRQTDRLPEAEASARRAVALDPALSEGWLNLIMALARQDKNQEFGALLDKAGPQLRDNPAALTAAADLSRRQGDPATAVRLYREALKAQPGNAGAWHDLGETLEASGREDEAIDAYKEASRLRPDRAATWNNLGNVYARTGQHALALDTYEQAARLIPGDTGLLLNKAATQLNLGQNDAAFASYRAALQQQPAQPTALLGVARAELARGQPQAAQKALAEARRLSRPDAFQAALLEGQIALALNEPRKAEGLLAEAVRLNPQSATAWHSLGVARFNQGQRAPAASLREPYEKLLTLDSTLAARYRAEILDYRPPATPRVSEPAR